MYKGIKIIAFDADDTLWENEAYFREAEDEFAKMFTDYETENKIHQELFRKQIENLSIYGYGIKGFVLSMVECALGISNKKVGSAKIEKILEIGKEMFEKPIELVENIKEVLSELKGKYKLIVVTKGDLLDQQRKLEKSGLVDYFHHIEVLSDKKVEDYKKMLKRLEINPKELLMIGNSLKSDVLPLIKVGASAIHIPSHTTWEHEKVSEEEKSDEYKTLSNIKEILKFL